MYMADDLRWDFSSQGPAHNCVWHAICLGRSLSLTVRCPDSFFTVRGRELGDGRGYRKGEAQDEAARMAIGALSLNPAPRTSILTIRRRKSFP